VNARSWLRLFAVVLAAVVFQVAVLDQIVVLGAHADVMVLIPAAAGLVGGPERGAVVGFVTGLVADLVVSLPFGLSALTFTVLGFGVGLLGLLPASRDAMSVRVGACAAAGASGTAFYALAAVFLHQHGVLGASAASAVVIVALGALVLAYPTLVLVRWVLAGSASSSFIPSGGSAA